MADVCTGCGGTGELQCSSCGGKGKTAGFVGLLSRSCRDCLGTGEDVCPTCRGTGQPRAQRMSIVERAQAAEPPPPPDPTAQSIAMAEEQIFMFTDPRQKRMGGIQALVELGPSGWKALVRLIRKDQAFSRILLPPYEGMSRSIAHALESVGTDATEVVLAGLADQRPVEDPREKLGRERYPLEPGTLEPALGAAHFELARILGRIGDPLAIPGLVEASTTMDMNARVGALEALGRIQDPRSIAAVCDAIDDDSLVVRMASRHAVRALKAVAAVPALIARQTRADPSEARELVKLLDDLDPDWRTLPQALALHDGG